VTRLPAVFLHGVGAAGRRAWPAQQGLADDRSCWFLDRLAPGDPPDRGVERCIDQLTGPTHVVAHSYGAIAAALLADRRPDLVASLVLVEPALLHLSRDEAHTRKHVDDLAPVFELADARRVDAREFSRRFAEASGRPVPQVSDEELVELIGHLRATVPPWTFEVDPAFVSAAPTLVALGGEDSMYAEVAASLAARGAQVRTWPGTGHRPHDSAEFTAVLAAHWRLVEQGQPART
jgi:pimeloyl-ACP methyl ester carboxylesterase